MLKHPVAGLVALRLPEGTGVALVPHREGVAGELCRFNRVNPAHRGVRDSRYRGVRDIRYRGRWNSSLGRAGDTAWVAPSLE